MLLERHYLTCLSQASYLIVDEESKTAVVVDPRRDVEIYLERAAELGATIRHVLLTHFHADFVSGHLELARRTGATIHMGAAASPEFEFEGLADGDALELGSVRIVAMATPGHTPESTCYQVHDLRSSQPQPEAVLTGDTLFVGDVGRPDLMASVGVTSEELASELYRSTREKLLALPDSTRVHPGHGAGSMCGKSLSDAEFSTIGEERASNPALRPLSEQEFVAEITAGQPTAPAYFAHDAAFNKRERETIDEVLARGDRALSVDEVRAAIDGGALLVDTRGPVPFAEGHVEGAVGVGLDGKFATFAGTVIDPERELVVMAEPGREREALTRLARVGLDRVVGRVADVDALLAAGPVRRFERVGTEVLAKLGSDGGPSVALDVRGPGEWAAGHLPGALHVPLGELAERVGEVPADREVLLVCGSGYRSSVAAGLLERAGRTDFIELEGGMNSVPEEARVRP